jgi:hypothetical protein
LCLGACCSMHGSSLHVGCPDVVPAAVVGLNLAGSCTVATPVQGGVGAMHGCNVLPGAYLWGCWLL